MTGSPLRYTSDEIAARAGLDPVTVLTFLSIMLPAMMACFKDSDDPDVMVQWLIDEEMGHRHKSGGSILRRTRGWLIERRMRAKWSRAGGKMDDFPKLRATVKAMTLEPNAGKLLGGLYSEWRDNEAATGEFEAIK